MYALAEHLKIDSAEFINLPNLILFSARDTTNATTDTYFIESGGRLSLGKIEQIYEHFHIILHNGFSVQQATRTLKEFFAEKPVYHKLLQYFFAFSLSAIICPLAFNGSFLDLWFSGIGAIVLSIIQHRVGGYSTLHGNLCECVSQSVTPV